MVLTSVDFFPITYNPSCIMRKTSNSNRVTSYKIPDQKSSKMSRSSKTKTVRNCHSQNEPKETWLSVMRYAGWETGSGKGTGERLRKSEKTMDLIVFMYQYWFINHNRGVTLIWGVNNGETGCRVYGNFVLSFPLFSKPSAGDAASIPHAMEQPSPRTTTNESTRSGAGAPKLEKATHHKIDTYIK